MNWISTEDRLPRNNDYVLVHLIDKPWLDNDDIEGKRFFQVAKFLQGKTREELKGVITSSDQWGNNLKPYCWSEFGPSTHWGQEVDFWMEIPEFINNVG